MTLLTTILATATTAFLLSPSVPGQVAPTPRNPNQGTPAGVTDSDWAGIRAAYESIRHAARPVEGGYQAHNPGQGWTTRFDGRGFTTAPDSGDWTWGLELRSYGFLGAERAIEGRASVASQQGEVAYEWGPTLEEWYRNDTRGLEHGYTVSERPPAGDTEEGELAFFLAVRGALTPVVSADGRDVAFVDDAGGTRVDYAGLKVFDADGDLLPARFESVGEGLRLTIDEQGARYPLTIDPVAQQAYLKASNPDDSDQFGWSVSVSGDTAVVGARGEDSGAAGINGNQLDNGAHDSGAAFVFVRDSQTGTWSQQAYLKASNTDIGDQFGWSVSVSGDTAVVGAPAEDSGATGANGNQLDNGAHGSGAAFVFVRDSQTGTWSQQAYLKASNADAGDAFGYSLSISSDTLVVGAVGEASGASGAGATQADNSAASAGAVYVFVRDPQAGTWSQQAYLKASNADADDWFGCSVTVSQNTAVVGAFGEDSNATGVNATQADNGAEEAGAAYVFVRDTQTNYWSQQAYLKASNTDAGDRFGFSVTVSADTVVVGAPEEAGGATGIGANQADNGAVDAGAAYVFERDSQAGTWRQGAYLKASNADAHDRFGLAVSVSGGVVVVGAPGEKSSATGVNGNQHDESWWGAGAAYVFVRSAQAAGWSQQAYLKPFNTSSDDQFAQAVSISEGTVIIGAPREDGDATGVNGNGSDHGAYDTGAAYVFTVPCGSIASYGSGCPGLGGFVPDLSASGCAVGGGTVHLELDGGLGGAPTLLLVGTAQASLPVGAGCTLLVQPPMVFVVGPTLSGTGAGNGGFDLVAKLPIATPLGTMTVQAAVADPAAGIGFGMTNGLRFDVE